jgi:carbon monoxide dehydrogenase subunit G
MVHVQRTFTVNRPRDEVVAYLADFANATEWDPGTVSCDPITPGPVEVGSQWRNVSSLAGSQTELTYTLTSLDADRVVLTGVNKTATSVDDIRVADRGTTSEVTYDATVTFNGLAKLASPFMQVLFLYLGVKTEKQMQDALAR